MACEIAQRNNLQRRNDQNINVKSFAGCLIPTIIAIKDGYFTKIHEIINAIQ